MAKFSQAAYDAEKQKMAAAKAKPKTGGLPNVTERLVLLEEILHITS